MNLYSIEKDKEILFYLIEDTKKKFPDGITISSINTFKGFCFTPLKSIALKAEDIIVDINEYLKDPYRYNGELKFKGVKFHICLTPHLQENNSLKILKTLQDEGLGILNANEKQIFLRILLGELFNLGELSSYEFKISSMPIVFNGKNLMKSLDELFIKRYGLNWKDGLNFPGMIQYEDGCRAMLYMALYFASIGLDSYEYMSEELNFQIYYHNEKSLKEFKDENDDILKYFKPEFYGVDKISDLKSVYLSSLYHEYGYQALDIDNNTVIYLVKKILTDYYEPILKKKKAILKKIYRNLDVPTYICSRKEKNKIFKEIFMSFGYEENLIDEIQKGKFTPDKFKTKEDILKYMKKVINLYEEWWQDCGLLPWTVIDNHNFCEWLKVNKPKSYYNASIVSMKEGYILENLDLDIILAYSTGGTAYLVLDKKSKSIKNKNGEEIVDISSEYTSKKEEQRQMELVAEYALIDEESLMYLLEIFNEAFD